MKKLIAAFLVLFFPCYVQAAFYTVAMKSVANNTFTGTNAFQALTATSITVAGNVVVTSTAGKPIEATSSVNGTGTILSRSQTSGTTTGKPSLLNYSKSTGDIADGFPSVMRFCVEDTGVSDAVLGEIGAVRAGADNTGDIAFFPATAGTMNERMRITSAGAVLVDTGTVQQAANAGVVIGKSKKYAWNDYQSADHYIQASGGNMNFGYNNANIIAMTLSGSSAANIYSIGTKALLLGSNSVSYVRINSGGGVTISSSTVLIDGTAGNLKAPMISGSGLPTSNYAAGTFFFDTATGKMNVSTEAVSGVWSWKALW